MMISLTGRYGGPAKIGRLLARFMRNAGLWAPPAMSSSAGRVQAMFSQGHPLAVIHSPADIAQGGDHPFHNGKNRRLRSTVGGAVEVLTPS